MSRHGERGSALVEFALVVPVFFLVVIGAATLVWQIGARSTITGAARDGARFASIAIDPSNCDGAYPCYPDEDAVEAYVRQRADDDTLEVELTRWQSPEDIAEQQAAADDIEDPVPMYRNQELTVVVTGKLENVFASFSKLTGLGDLDYSSTARARTE